MDKIISDEILGHLKIGADLEKFEIDKESLHNLIHVPGRAGVAIIDCSNEMCGELFIGKKAVIPSFLPEKGKTNTTYTLTKLDYNFDSSKIVAHFYNKKGIPEICRYRTFSEYTSLFGEEVVVTNMTVNGNVFPVEYYEGCIPKYPEKEQVIGIVKLYHNFPPDFRHRRGNYIENLENYKYFEIEIDRTIEYIPSGTMYTVRPFRGPRPQ